MICERNYKLFLQSHYSVIESQGWTSLSRMASIPSILSCSKILKIHRIFAYPMVKSLSELLNKTAPDKYDSSLENLLNDIMKHCQSWQTITPKPFVFQVTLPDSINFNHELLLDMTLIEPHPHEPSLYFIGGGTHLFAAEFLRGESAADVWNAFISC